jgi:hypothetical protein
VTEPLSQEAATALIKAILQDGQIAHSQHAIDELLKDDMTTVDSTNVMRAGRVKLPAELHRHEWRYRIETSRMAVVIAFLSETELRVVTAWRAKR